MMSPAATTAPATTDRETPPPRARRSDLLHLMTLWSFAVAQPLYDRLGQQGNFLIDQNISPAVIYTLCGLLSLGLPAGCMAVLWLAGWCSRNCYEVGYRLHVAGLLMLILLPASRRLEALLLPGWGIMLCAMIATGALWACYFRWSTARAVVSWAGLGILLFPLLFISQSPALRKLVAVYAQLTNNWQPVPVVMVVFDEFCGATIQTPEHEIDATRFPHFAALARESTWFRNAATVSPDTVRALPAILSSRYPQGNLIPTNRQLPQNLFHTLAGTGAYDLAIFEPVSALAPRQPPAQPSRNHSSLGRLRFLCDILSKVYLFQITPQAWHRQLPEIPRVWFGLAELSPIDQSARRGVFTYTWGAQRDQQFQHFLNTLDGSERPTLHFMHILLPHLPWSFEPEGRRYAPDGEDSALLDTDTQHAAHGAWANDELLVARQQQRYLLQVLYVDQLLGQLVARLRETGMYDRCLLVVTADHGISFRPGVARRKFTPENQAEILSVPLLIKRPGQTMGQRDDRPVETIDIFPTICDELGLALQQPVDGRSLWNTSLPHRTEYTLTLEPRQYKIAPSVVAKSSAQALLRSRFGSGADPQALYRIGPAQNLIGQPAQALLARETQPQVQLVLTAGQDTLHADADTEIPAFFAGRVVSRLPTDEPVLIAVAVNGTIQGVTRTYLDAVVRNQWELMLPPQVFRPGKNAVAYYSVQRNPNGVQKLQPCQIVTESTTK